MIYNAIAANGQVTKHIEIPDSSSIDEATAQLEAGEILLETDLDHLTQYIVGVGTTNTTTTRPLLSTIVSWNKTSILANNSDTATLSSVPNGSSYSIAVPFGVAPVAPGTTTTSLNFKTDFPGEYIITLESFPYQLYTQTITAT